MRYAPKGRPPRGGADRNPRVPQRQPAHDTGRPPRGGADRNMFVEWLHNDPASRPPRGGADRNIYIYEGGEVIGLSPPTRGRGSKPAPAPSMSTAPGRPPRGGADRNCALSSSRLVLRGRPPRGGADRNTKPDAHRRLVSCRPPRGGADRNEMLQRRLADKAVKVAPHAGARIETTRW